jgi:hypothetical protein
MTPPIIIFVAGKSLPLPSNDKGIHTDPQIVL